jgi:hypothetical protein
VPALLSPGPTFIPPWKGEVAYLHMRCCIHPSVQLASTTASGYTEERAREQGARSKRLALPGPCCGSRSMLPAQSAAVTDPRATYLLPCSCGRDIPIGTRQAGETVTCECGRASSAPTLREMQGLRRVSLTRPSAAAQSGWGNSQRFLVAGTIIFVLAAVAAVTIYWQIPTRYKSAEEIRQMVGRKTTWQTVQYFHGELLPGIELREREIYEAPREQALIGVAALAGLGAIGLILAAVGVVGLARKR